MKRSQRGRRSGDGRSFAAFLRRQGRARPTGLGRLAALCAAVIVLGTTCTDSTGPGDPPTPTSMQAVSATAQEAIASSAVPDAPAVIVRDQDGTAMAGISVAFTVSLGGGTVNPSTVVTGGDGVARVASWTLGGTPGNNTVVAALSGLTAVSFSANGLQPPPVATTVEAASALTQQVEVGAGVADPPAVLVRDQNNEPMANVAVAFAVAAGGGVIAPATVTTGSDGIARVTSWTVGASAGANAATATVAGLVPVAFAATAVTPQVAVATSVEAVTALSQSALTGTAVADPPGVLVRGQNNAPMAGVAVAFAITAGGGVIAPAEQITGADGIARAISWQLGPAPAINGATATVTGLAPVTFTAEGVAPPVGAPAKIEAVSSTNQVGAPNTAVAARPTVRVLDANDQPLAGVNVAFAVSAGGGSIAPASQVTGSDGRAQITIWTLGPGTGLNTVTATVSGLAPVQFNANAIVATPAPTSITAVTPLAQQTPVGTAVGTPPAVIVRDQFGAPLPGIAVAFTVTIGGGTAVPGSVVTGGNGVAALTSWTVGAGPGGNSVIATVGTLPAVVFNATGFVPTAPASLSAESPLTQQAPAGGAALELPTVLVRDQNQNPLPGVTVAFAVSGGSGSVSPATVVTGPLGTARLTTWTLATTPGPNSVTATVSGLAPVTFAATGILVPGAVEPITTTTQTAPVGTSVTEPPGVIVRDQFGAPLGGAQVVFAITAGGGSATPLATSTLADGTARLSTWTLGPSAGPNTITATVAGLPPISFSAGGVQPAAVASSVEPVTVQVQEGAAGSPVAVPPGVRVRDQNNDPMAGVSVNFTVTSGGGSVVPSTVVTGSDGIAQLTSWTLGMSAGANTLAAAVTGLAPVSFSATAELEPGSIEATTPTSQQAPASSSVASPPGVIVRDQFGNPLAGVTVSFAVTAGGGTRSPATVTTGANGVAQLSSWTLGSAAGVNTLTATASDLAQTVTFNATAILVASSVQATTALTQEAAAGAAVSQPPGVIVRDNLNNPIAGVTVSFVVTGGSGSVSPSSVVTGTNGIAQLTSWTLGTAPGSNTVTATVSGLAPVTFSAVGNLVSATIEATTATSQQTPAGSPVPQPPGVIVRDQFGAPRPGVTVTFAVTAGGGSITPSSVVTGTNGIAQLTNWTLGAGAGTNTVTAAVTGLAPVTFNATAIVPGPPTSVQAVTATNQEAPAGSLVPQPPGVIVRDGNSLPVPGVTVAFAVTSGGGSVNPASVVTGSDGIAQLTSWTLGNAQTHTVSATVSGLAPVVFTATRSATALVATTIQATTALNQQALAGAVVPEAPGVIVRDQFAEPLPGVTVSFAVTAGGGTRSPATVTTGANGVAQLTSWTLGSAAGVNTLTATASGLAQTVTFNATGTLVATSVQATTALTQEAAAGAVVSQPPGVIVRDHLNNPMAGVTVSFAVTTGGGSVAPASVVTGGDGVAQLTSWTLGTAGGSNSVTATVSGLTPVTFSAIGNLVSATIEATTATSQQAPAGSPVSQPPGVIVRDQFGAPRPGVTVTFAVTAGGGSITPSSVVTGTNGIAQLTNWTLGAGAGTNTVTATVTGLAPVTFNATGSLTPASIQANTPTTQQGPAGQSVAAPPGVIVRDQNDSPMQGVTVTFAVTGGGGSINPSSVVTGANGTATLTSWTLGTTPGANTVTATVSGVTPVTFTATGTRQATSVQAVTSTSQTVPAGGAVPEPPGVIVRDQNGLVMQGVSVAFAVTAGGGSINPASQSTGADGIARLTNWTVGSTAGPNNVTATVSGLTPVTFTATATLVATTMQATTPTSQQAQTGSPVSQPPGVIVRDNLNNPMQGVTVTFAVTAGGGSVNPSAVVTGANGTATLTSWTLGTSAGTNTVTASASGVPTVTFNAAGVRTPTSLTATTALTQEASAGTAVSQPPGVLVRDHLSLPMQGVSVTFAVTAGGGVVSPTVQVTGADGVAQASSWTLGPGAGNNTVTANAAGLTPVTFTATSVLVPSSVLAVTPLTQEAAAGAAVSQPPGVIVRDQLGSPVPGISVSFAVTGGGGAAGPSTVVTGADGTARVTSWTLGASPGTNTLTASVSGLPTVTFTATGIVAAGSIEAVSALSQQAPANSFVPDPPGVRVRNQSGGLMSGVTVTFAVTSGTGTVSPGSVVTGSDGIARLASWRLGIAPGANSVVASVAGLPSVTFAATGTAVISSVQAVTPLNQSASAGTQVQQPPGVIVRDQNNNPVQGVPVAFAATSGGGSVSPSSVTTNASGIAQLNSWTVGTGEGTSTATATVSGLPTVTFSATKLVPGSGSLQPVTATNQQARVGTAVTQPPGVLVRDQNNNPLPGVSVSFAITAGGGSTSPSPVTTGADGVARLTSWTLGGSAGANSVTATVTGLPSLTFTATGLAPTTVVAVTALNQQAPPGASVAQPPGVLVRDQNGNPLQGVTVAFAVTSGGGSPSPASAVTGANGMAQLTSWTLGGSPGANTLTATVAGVTPVVFTATATALPASVQAASATSQQAVAGTAVTELPAVLVRDQNNNPIQGVAVVFAVTAGGGSTFPAAQATGADGIARLTNWTLGILGGANTVTATVGTLPVVTFNATGLLAASIQAITPTSQSVPTLGLVPEPPGVIVRNQSGAPMQGVPVVFEMAQEGGFVTPVVVPSGTDGTARVTAWRVGADPGAYVLEASVRGLSPIAFTANAVAPPAAPASIAAVTAVSQSAAAGSNVAQPPGVIVRNSANEPLAGISVAFTVTGGGGTATPAAVLTGADGVAQLTSWTLGTIGGSNTLTATVSGLSPVAFTATATSPPALVPTFLLAGTTTNQQAPAGSAVSQPPGVIVRDQHSQSLSGVNVTFTVTSGGGSVNPTIVQTSSGFALVSNWTLGSTPGVNTLTATVPGLTPVTFTATGVRVASTMQALTPTAQQGAVGSPVASPPRVVVRDQNGNPLPGVNVSFAVTGGGGSLLPSVVQTDAAGTAQLTHWTLGAAPGSNTLSASVAGVTPIVFTATGLASSTSQAITPTSQSAAAGAPVSAPPGVLIRDQNGNPLSGIPVTFSVTAGGGGISPDIVATAADGTARTTSWTLGSIPGTNTVTASAAGVATVTFTATGTAIAATVAATTPTSQQAPAGSSVPQPPGVIVRDQNNNPLAGATVTFAVTAGGGAIAPATVVTNVSGVAQLSSWTLGPAPGANSVSAAVGSLSPITFSATGTRVATSVQPVAPLTQRAPIGMDVPEPPSVRVRDQNNNPLPGVGVLFTITSGGGAPSSAAHITGADGIARATRWTVGPAQGSNTMTATVTGFAPVTFTAFGMTPTSLVAVTPTSQEAPAGGAAPIPPGVLIRDQNQNPLPGVPVTFAVVAGGGLLLPNPPVVTTGSDGIARAASWALGTTPGTNTVTATTPSLPIVTFNATGLAGECPPPQAISLGPTVGGTLGSTGCGLSSGELAEFYSFTITQQTAVRITMSSAVLDPYVLLLKSTGATVAENDDVQPGINASSELFAILAPGSYIVAASSSNVGESGSFSLRVEPITPTVTGGETYFATRGISASQSLTTSDYDDAGYWSDFYVVYLQAGETVTIQMNSSQFDSYLMFLGAGGLIEDNNGGGGDNARIVYTSPTARFYLFAATSNRSGETGAYTLTVQ